MLQRFLLFAVPCIFVLTMHRERAVSERDDEDRIEWSATRKLTWDDFKGAPDPSSPNAALTNSTINIEYGYDKSGLKHLIRCGFNKSKSWVKTKNDYILNHEQLHFDIAEVHARMLHKEIKEYRFNSRTVDADISAIYNRIVKAHTNTQRQYDLETHHSLDTAKQQEWNGRVEAMLRSMADFAGYH